LECIRGNVQKQEDYRGYLCQTITGLKLISTENGETIKACQHIL